MRFKKKRRRYGKPWREQKRSRKSREKERGPRMEGRSVAEAEEGRKRVKEEKAGGWRTGIDGRERDSRWKRQARGEKRGRELSAKG